MNTFQRFFSKALASLMLAGLCLLFTSSTVKCQTYSCPSGAPDYTSVPWVSGGCFFTTVDGCYVKICYCVRYIAAINRTDFCIAGIFPQTVDGNPCSGIGWNQFINDCINSSQLVKDGVPTISSSYFSCPHCPNYTFNFNMTAMTCFFRGSYPLNNGTSVKYTAPCLGGEWCCRGYEICCDPTTGAVTIQGTGSPSHFGTACSVNIMPLVNTEIVDGTCYEVVTCDQ